MPVDEAGELCRYHRTVMTEQRSSTGSSLGNAAEYAIGDPGFVPRIESHKKPTRSLHRGAHGSIPEDQNARPINYAWSGK